MEDIFKLSASPAASKFFEWVRYDKYQVKPHLHGFQMFVLLP